MKSAKDLMGDEPIALLALKLFDYYKKMAEANGFRYLAHGFNVSQKEYHEDYIIQNVYFGGRLEFRSDYEGSDSFYDHCDGDDCNVDDYDGDGDDNDDDCDGELEEV